MSTFPNVRLSVRGANPWPGLLAGLLLLSFLAGPAVGATAANFVIPAGTSGYTFNGTTQGVQPGQVIELAAGVHGPRRFSNIAGTASQPVIIRSATNGQAIIRRVNPSIGGFVFEIRASRHFVIDGSNISTSASGHPYGIKIMYASNATAENMDAPSVFLKTSGDIVTPQVFNNCSDFAIRYVAVDGGWPTYSSNGIGIHTNDARFKAADFPGAWQQGILIEHNLVLNVEGEGLYIGPNYYEGGIPLRNIEIRHNRIEHTGWDGLQVKSVLEGRNSIHHNHLRNVGADSGTEDAAQLSGLSIIDGSGEIYNNYVERAGDTGIKHRIADVPSSFGPLSVRIFNNVVVDAGVIGLLSKYGITSGGDNTSRAGLETARAQPMIFNNTIVRSRGIGIGISSNAAPGGYVRDNIIADAGSSAISAPTSVSSTNNLVSTVPNVEFVNATALDFRLLGSSSARDSGGSTYPLFDFDDVARPQDGKADRGAFEYRAADAPSFPNPPEPVLVE